MPANDTQVPVIEPKLPYVAIAFAAITLFRPFYYWGDQHILVGALAFALGVGSCVWLLARQERVLVSAFTSACCWLLVVAWQLLPVRPQLSVGVGVVAVVLVFGFLILHGRHKANVLLQIQIIVGILGFTSTAVVLALAIGFDLPYYRLDQNFRADPDDFFLIYPGAVMLSSQGYPIPFGGVLFRSSGIFAEPGHFGVVCGLALAASGFSLRSWREKGIFLGGISTFSGAFLVIGIVGFSIALLSGRDRKIVESMKIWSVVILVVPIVSAGFLASPQDFQDRILWSRLNNLQTIADIYESRVKEEDRNRRFNEYRTSPQSLIGLGQDIEAMSDWRAEVFKYGWPIIVLYSLFYLSLLMKSRVDLTYRFQVFSALAIIAFHRSGYIDMFLVIAIVAGAFANEFQASRSRLRPAT